jgi:4-hydroxy-3-methylbut-2-enyl diphosphate reductase
VNGHTLLVYAPLRLEEASLSPSLRRRARVIRSGAGPGRARIAAARGLAVDDARGVAVVGVCAATQPGLEPGDVLVASELRRPDGVTIPVPGGHLLASAVRRSGLRAVVGPLASAERIAGPCERRYLGETGVSGVDMESAWLADGVGGRPLAVLRTVVETVDRELLDPRTVLAGARALRTLRRATGALDRWADALRPRRVLLAAPRSFCAGVERAIEIVELALEQRGAPIYVRKQIVHNEHVVASLESRGAVFVEEVDEIPRDATAVFSAHGVSPAVRVAARERNLDVIDATCPLVSKVHAEARQFAADGNTILLIGHDGHEEIEGTAGEAPESVVLVEDVRDAERVSVPDPRRVTYLTQTTLAVDETAEILDVLRRRFPALRGPRSDDICYATTNRQLAVREVAHRSDVVLVVGSRTSSNSLRLVEVSEREGTTAYLVDDEHDVDLDWVADAGTIGISAGASAPDRLVQQVVEAIGALGEIEVEEATTASESVSFRLPPEVRTG